MGCICNAESINSDNAADIDLIIHGTPQKQFIDAIIPVNVHRVIDGDTIVGSTSVKLYGYPTMNIIERFRLASIDTPELRSKDPVEKNKAYTAKGVLENVISSNGGWCVAHCFGQDSFGRILATLYTDKCVNINNYILQHPECGTHKLLYNERHFNPSDEDIARIKKIGSDIATCLKI